jgi:multidrug efflux pump subunit AcrA (membrane-fusion protein)
MFMLLNRNASSLKKCAFMVAAVMAVGLLSCTHPGQARADIRQTVHAQTEVLQPTTVVDEFQAPGTVRAKTQTTLSSKVQGQIIALRVREGDRVRQGELLVEIDARDASSQLRRAQAAETEARKALEEVEGSIRASSAALHAAEANRDLMQTTLKRYDILRERRSVSPQEFDEVDTRYKAAVADAERAQETLTATQARRAQVLARIEQAETEVETAGVNLSYLKIASPIDGIVTARKAEPGMEATSGMAILAIDDDSTYQLDSVVEESHAAQIRIGEDVRVEIDAVAATVGAKVRDIVPTSDPNTRTSTVKLDLSLTPQLRGNVHSGFFGRALFPDGERQVLTIPASALVRRGQLTGVYIVQDNVATLRLVRIGKQSEKGIEILSGLSPGARIVTAPGPEISDGVEIVNENREGTTP